VVELRKTTEKNVEPLPMNFVYGALSMRLQACYHTIRAKYRAANKTRLEGRGGGGVGDIFSILLSISAHSDDTFSGIYFRDGGETEWGPTKLKGKTSKDDEKGKYFARQRAVIGDSPDTAIVVC
jgi:hypothetical protein